jgi:endoglycosylceramidase
MHLRLRTLGCVAASSAPFFLAACSTSPSSSHATPSDAAPPSPDASSAAGEDAGACNSPDFAGSPLGVHCNALVDSQGRTVLLHGINARVNGVFDVAHADGRPPNEVDPDFTSDDATQIRSLGFNALRLPMQWSGVEPTEDGGFDESYLDRVAAVTAICGDAGVFVLVDIHQDLYSKEIGEDGAPLWAISPAPTVLIGTALPDGGAVTVPAAESNAAFATFFGGGTEGEYLDARYTAMAAHVAARFATDPAVFGIELFNEPLSSDDSIHPLYIQMIPAMRAAAPNKLLLWEPTALRNELDEAELGDGGSLGAGTVYAPHVYTNAFAGGDGFTEASLATSNVNARNEADSWAAPLVITEWGFDPADVRYADYVRFQQELQDEVRASAFYWLWKEESSGRWGLFDFTDDGGVATLRATVAADLARPRLEAAAGALVSVGYDATTQTFEAQFLGSAAITAPNVVSFGSALPPAAAQWKATCDGTAVATTPTGGADAAIASGLLAIVCNGDGPHTLVLTP